MGRVRNGCPCLAFVSSDGCQKTFLRAPMGAIRLAVGTYA
jgi:hypothetical protein